MLLFDSVLVLKSNVHTTTARILDLALGIALTLPSYSAWKSLLIHWCPTKDYFYRLEEL